MAFAHIGHRGAATSSASGTTLSLTPSSPIAAGRIVVVWVACDNRTFESSAGTFRDPHDVYCTDAAGNDYWQLPSVSPNQASGTHATAMLFVAKLKAALSGAITVTWLAPVVEKAMSVHEFSQTGATIAHYGGDREQRDAGDPSICELLSLRQQEYLVLHALAAEGPDSDSYTWDSDYTQITGAGTSGMHLRGGFRIAELSGTETIDVTSDTADRDNCQTVQCLVEVDLPDEFPEHPILDDANRADENPLSHGGMWSDRGENLGANPGGDPNPGLKLESNEIVIADETHIDNFDRYYWNLELPCNDSEVYATLSSVPSASSSAQTIPLPPTNPGTRGMIVLRRHIFDSGGIGTTGYMARWRRRGRDWTDGAPMNEDILQLFPAYFAGQSIALHVLMTAGWSIGVKKVEYIAHLYVDRGSGWEWIAAQDVNRLDPNPQPGTDALGLQVEGEETGVVDFGGGFRCPRRPPAIYRRVIE